MAGGFKEKPKDIRKMSGSLAERLNDKYKKQVVFSAQEAPHRPKYKIPFSSLTLNRLTGGGVTVPRITQLFGPSSVYKSTGVYDLIARAQRLRDSKKSPVPLASDGKPMYIVLVDAERSVNEVYLKNCGIDVSDPRFIILDNFESGDECIDQMVDILESGDCMLLCLDSLTSLISRREKETLAGNLIKLQGWRGKFTSGLFIKIHNANHGSTAVVFVNQIRDTLGDRIDRARGTDVNYTPTGGHAPQFYSSEIIELTHYMEERDPVAKKITAPGRQIERKVFNSWLISARVHKTRSSGQDNAELFFRFIPKTASIDRYTEAFNMAVKDGIITNRGAFYYYIDESGEETRIGQGVEKVRITLSSDEKLFNEICNRVNQKSRDIGGL
jgi:RecA/RadA recombinase